MTVLVNRPVLIAREGQGGAQVQPRRVAVGFASTALRSSATARIQITRLARCDAPLLVVPYAGPQFHQLIQQWIDELGAGISPLLQHGSVAFSKSPFPR